MLTATCVAFLCSLCTTAPLLAWQAGRVEEDKRPEVPRELQVQIDRAIDRGVETLIEQQELDGSWRHDFAGYGAGATGLVAYTLMKCGIAPHHPAVVRAFEFMERHPPSRTYSIATVMMAIGARGDTRDRKWMEQLLDVLLSWRQGGGWGYPDNRPDLSNTQFAGLALRAADLLGVSVKQKAWDDLGEAALEYFESTRGTSATAAGFYYERQGEPHTTGSMTAAGLTLVAIALEHVQGNRQSLIIAQKRALNWLDKHFTVDFNPKPEVENGRHGWDLYYLYGLERVGSLLGIESFGKHPWYELGARRLVGEQEASGRWANQADTCFALLFLARATNISKAVVSGQVQARASSERGIFGGDDPLADVSLRASGTGALTIWISSFGDRIRRSYAPDEAGQLPLPVKRVEYFIAPVPSEEPAVTFATLEADPASPPKDPRFAVKHTPIGPAEYELFADVTLVDIADGSDVVLRSKPVKLRVGLIQHPAFLVYAKDPDRNELAALTFTTTASSQHEGDYAPHLAVDNLQATGWRAATTDTRPWLRLEFERPPRVGELVLSPSLNPADLAPTPRPVRVRVTLNNDEKAPLEFTLDPDPRLKTRVPLPKGLRLRSLQIELLTFTKGATGPGLNEIELRPSS